MPDPKLTKSEHEARLPKLADGSRWSTDCSEPCATDDDGSTVVVSRIDARGGKCIAIRSEYGSSVAYVTDLLAVIRSANLDPLAIAAEELANACRSGSVAIHGGQSDAGSFFAALEKLEALL